MQSPTFTRYLPVVTTQTPDSEPLLSLREVALLLILGRCEDSLRMSRKSIILKADQMERAILGSHKDIVPLTQRLSELGLLVLDGEGELLMVGLSDRARLLLGCWSRSIQPAAKLRLSELAER